MVRKTRIPQVVSRCGEKGWGNGWGMFLFGVLEVPGVFWSCFVFFFGGEGFLESPFCVLGSF